MVTWLLYLGDEIHDLTAVFKIQVMNDSDDVKESLLHLGTRENEPGRSNETTFDLIIYVFLFSLWTHFDFTHSNTGILGEECVDAYVFMCLCCSV
jgi:hypothetical protein